MKKITLLFTLIIVSISFGQTNLFVNGDFESGTTTGAGWNNNNGGSYTTEAVQLNGSLGSTGGYTVDVAAKSGTYYGVKKGGNSALIQAVDVTAGKKYIFNFWFYNSYDTSVILARIRNFTGDVNGDFIELTPIVADTGKNAEDATKYGTKQSGGRVWKEAKFSFVIPAGVTKIRFLYWSNDTGYNFMDTVSMVEDTTASIENLKKFNFNTYPNPATHNLNISASKKIEKIEIFNLIGQKVLARETNDAHISLDVSNLKKGIYIIKAEIAGLNGAYKFIKK
jgi:hypothetical protein